MNQMFPKFFIVQKHHVLLFYAAESQLRIECLTISIRLRIVSFCLQGTNAEVVLLRSNTNKQ